MIQVVNKMIDANCITHSGTMHADEVFATAFLDLFLGDVKVYRTSSIKSEEVPENILVYDIGRGKFDHHQIDKEVRENKIPYSSVGLLWKEFGKTYLESKNYKYINELYDAIEKDLIEGIDADDNGVFPKIDAPFKVKTLPGIIKLFNPSFNANQDESEQFKKAVKLAETIWNEEILYINGKVIADMKVKKILEKRDKTKKYIILEEFLPYEETILNDEEANDILFVAFPSNRGGYAIKTISKSLDDKTARLNFPSKWAGLEGKELEETSQIKGLKFCHTGRFIVSCDNKDTVYEVLEKLCKEV